MWGHYTRVTVTHHCGSGTGGVIALLFAIAAASFAYTTVVALIPVIFWTLIVLSGIFTLFIATLATIHIYQSIRDKPVYEQFQKDTQLALDNYSDRDMMRVTSQRVEGDGSWLESTERNQNQV